MSKQKDILSGFGEELTGEVTKKRTAPDVSQTRSEAERKERERLISRGAVTRWRLHPDIGPAVKKAAEQEQITQRELMEYIITKALQGLATGKLELPKKQTGTIYSLEEQTIPRRFLERG